MIKKLLRLVAVSAVLCGGIVSAQVASSPQAQATCVSEGHRQTIQLRAMTNSALIAQEVPTTGTCNGDGTYRGRLDAGAGWTPYLLRKQGNQYLRVRRGNGPFSWSAGTKQSVLFFCAVRNGTQHAYCGDWARGEGGLVGFSGWNAMIWNAKGTSLSSGELVLDRGF